VAARRLDAELEARGLAERTSVRPDEVDDLLRAAGTAPLPHGVKMVDLARRQRVTLDALFAAAGIGADLPRDAVVTAELEIKYEGYFDREREQAGRLKSMGAFALDPDLPYDAMRSLSYEARQKLASVRPLTLSQAAGIPGVNPNDLQNLVIEIERLRRA
jgi:tRNA uridine 5-carboxymethylaminomethyl modification enzyme